MAKRPVVVTVCGQRYTVRSDADETYIRTLAGFVNARMTEIQQSTQAVPMQKLAVLAAMNIADELFRERAEHGEMRTRIAGRAEALVGMIEQAVGTKLDAALDEP
ncbi:MAG: cell division protein ZapA [Proteobacteria bacterium]|nr:cell division protein ZapA [Pseudomonadota bacterium]